MTVPIGRREDVEAGHPVTPPEQIELINDLNSAVEVNSSEGRQVLYPGRN